MDEGNPFAAPEAPAQAQEQEPQQEFSAKEPTVGAVRLRGVEPAQRVTTIVASIRPGRQLAFARRLQLIEQAQAHLFPGAIERMIAQSQTRPEYAMLVLIWDVATMPPEAEREAALAALKVDLEDVIDWQTAERSDQRLLVSPL